jgi:hypothetical protein
MANLIIKSSADNLVLQGSDASPAITVGATGTTTFAENATFSGTANNLGTSTAGTFTSGIAFPSGTGAAYGHVLQVVLGEDITALSLATTTYTDTGLSAAITPISASNKIIISWSMHADFKTANTGFGVKLLRDDGGGYDDVYTSNVLHNMYNNGSGTGDSRMMGSWVQDDVPAVTTATTYKIQAASYQGNAITLNEGGSLTYITLMEVVA